VAKRYDAALQDLDGITPILLPDQAVSNYYKYVALLDPHLDRVDVKAALRQRGVSPSGEVYATPLHREPVFAQLATPPLPVAEDVCARQLCLPIHSDMSDAEVDYVLESLAQVLDAVQRPEGIAS
jgi:dTDP-4-amino-4,6-dideoxygalactose transaminase